MKSYCDCIRILLELLIHSSLELFVELKWLWMEQLCFSPFINCFKTLTISVNNLIITRICYERECQEEVEVEIKNLIKSEAWSLEIWQLTAKLNKYLCSVLNRCFYLVSNCYCFFSVARYIVDIQQHKTLQVFLHIFLSNQNHSQRSILIFFFVSHTFLMRLQSHEIDLYMLKPTENTKNMKKCIIMWSSVDIQTTLKNLSQYWKKQTYKRRSDLPALFMFTNKKKLFKNQIHQLWFLHQRSIDLCARLHSIKYSGTV